ncbi:MAG: hypothetical protein ACXW2U_08800 [Telluria sp.]
MSQFKVTVRTPVERQTFLVFALSSAEAYAAAAEEHGDTPCGITVTPA